MKDIFQIFIITLSMAFIALLPLNSGYAVDMGNPLWVRPTDSSQTTGDTNTTFQEWQENQTLMTIGDGQPFNGPNGPSSVLNTTLTSPLISLANPTVGVNNFIDQEPFKWVYIQVTTRAPIDIAPGIGGASFISNITTIPAPAQFTLLNDPLSPVHNQAVTDGFYSAELWQISGGDPLHNPEQETFSFVDNFQYDHIVIDTRSFNGVVPEPATMAILGSSLVLGVLAKRKAKNLS